MEKKFKFLAEPIRIGSLTVKNRVWMAPCGHALPRSMENAHSFWKTIMWHEPKVAPV